MGAAAIERELATSPARAGHFTEDGIDAILRHKLGDDGGRFGGVRAIILYIKFDLFAVDAAGLVGFVRGHLDAVH